jgi:hypothetical protein
MEQTEYLEALLDALSYRKKTLEFIETLKRKDIK